jgi:Baseplate J-like protein
VNTDTVNLIERPYVEIVDDLLTAMVGGVVNEPIIFDLKSNLYPLAQPAKDVRGITGTIEAEGKPDGVHHTFLKEVDFVFNADKSAVVWQDSGQKPRDESTFYVDYFLPASRSPLTDINVGSVTRTLSEAIGREIATVYQQINLAYLSGFIDTAKGKALDFVVSILGVTRKTKEFAVGQATFFRDSAIEGNITIPQATELSTTKAEALFETIEPRTLQRGQARIDAPIRAGEKFKGPAGKVEAGKITNISQVIAGISRVTNFEPTVLAAEDESDDDLRLRAKAALRGVGKATILALTKAVFDSRATLKEISDPNTSGKQTLPGTVTMLVETEPARFPGVVAAVNDVRAAGVQVTIAARFVFVKLRMIANIPAGTTAAGKTKFANEIIAAIQQTFEKLGAEKPVTGKALLEVIKSVKDVTDPKIVDVRTSRSDVGKPGTKFLVEALVANLTNVNPSDQDALRKAIEETIDTEGPTLVPHGPPDPDRSLVQGVDTSGDLASGKRATDGEIETGKFVIVPPPQFSLILDTEPSDIVFNEV